MAKAVSHSLNNCVNCLPGQKDVDMALKSIGESSKKLLVDSVSVCLRWYSVVIVLYRISKEILLEYNIIIHLYIFSSS